MVAVALAGSLFFSIDPTQARWKVALYLLFTLAPFAVVAPLIGPAIDRINSGSRWVITATAASRALVSLLMIRHVDELWLFPEAFALLVMTKAYAVAKSAYVPSTASGERALVAANSRLALVAAVATPAGAMPAAVLAWAGGAPWVMALAMVTFAGTTALSVGQLGEAPPGGPQDTASSAPGAAWRARPKLSAAVWLGTSAMGSIRLVVGFLTFLVAFELRQSSGAFGYGMVLTSAAAGGLAGSALAPTIRRSWPEERMLAGSLLAMGTGGLLGALVGGLVGAMVVGAIVGTVSGVAKQAFDAVVQRETDASDVGRVFAQNEAQFQVLWVLGAFVPVLIPLPARLGFLVVGIVGGVGAASYLAGRHLFDLDRLRVIAGFAPSTRSSRPTAGPPPSNRSAPARPPVAAGPPTPPAAPPVDPFPRLFDPTGETPSPS